MSMSEVKRKLAEYRARKEREALFNHYKAQAKSIFSLFWVKKKVKEDVDMSAEITIEESTEKLLPRSQSPVLSEADSCDDSTIPNQEKTSLTLFDYVQYTLWFILWTTVYAIFIKLEFGTVYLIISALIAMYLNTRTGQKKKNEPSAYSVFNKNCEKIDGTLDGEKMTQQMLYGGFAR